jgi:hypothetical protein
MFLSRPVGRRKWLRLSIYHPLNSTGMLKYEHTAALYLIDCILF